MNTSGETRDELGVVALDAPSATTARERFERGFERGAMITLFGRCTVEYDGRASSRLAAGNRNLLYKPDGTVLVHTAEGHDPVNWQPPGCEHSLAVDAGSLELRSRRSNPEEELLVRFERIAHLAVLPTGEVLDSSVSGTEEDLRERVLSNPELIESGFRPLATERRTSAGAIDVYGEDSTGATVAVELKRRRVGPDAAGQLKRYVDALERELHADAEIRGILVAPSITDRTRELLATEGLEFVSVLPTE